MKIQLTKEILDDGKAVKEISLRELTAKEIIKNGMPFYFNKDNEMVVNTKSMGSHISDLAGIPPSSVEQLSPIDFIKLQTAVINFFNAGQST